MPGSDSLTQMLFARAQALGHIRLARGVVGKTSIVAGIVFLVLGGVAWRMPTDVLFTFGVILLLGFCVHCRHAMVCTPASGTGPLGGCRNYPISAARDGGKGRYRITEVAFDCAPAGSAGDPGGKMSHRIYYIGIRWEPYPAVLQVETVDRVLAPFGDWIRLNGLTWFLSTSNLSAQIYENLRVALTSAEHILVIALDPTDRFGWAPQWIWDWIDSQRKEPPKTLAGILGQAPTAIGIGGQQPSRSGIAPQSSLGGGILGAKRSGP